MPLSVGTNGLRFFLYCTLARFDTSAIRNFDLHAAIVNLDRGNPRVRSNHKNDHFVERQTIIELLKENHRLFINYINSLTNDEFLISHQEKWTAGQQLDHIYLSVKPLVLAVSLPKFIIRLLFGKANRSGKTFEGLVKKYQTKLENGGKATGRFIPKTIALNQKETLGKALSKTTNVLCRKIENFTEQELDSLILPHPLLGKLTIREMLYFTIYHVEHHHEITKRNLKLLN